MSALSNITKTEDRLPRTETAIEIQDTVDPITNIGLTATGQIPFPQLNPQLNRREDLNNSHVALQYRMLTGAFPRSSRIGTEKIEELTVEKLVELLKLNQKTGERYFGPVAINLSTECVTDENLKAIVETFPNIREIHMFISTGFTDYGLFHLAKLTNLTHLNLGGCMAITDHGLFYLTKLTSLTHLNLMACNITDDGLAHLATLPNLTSLDLSGCKQITDNGLAHLATLPNLTRLDLSKCKQITDNGLAHLANLTSLTRLDLDICENITETGLTHLAKLTNLICLNCDFPTHISYYSVAQLGKTLVNCAINGIRFGNK